MAKPIFVQISTTINDQGIETVYVLDEAGVVWYLVVGQSEEWHKLTSKREKPYVENQL